MLLSIYLDTCVFKFSATELPRFVPRVQKTLWGDREHEITVHDFVYINRNKKIPNDQALKEELEYLPLLAELGKQNKVKYVVNIETLIEFWGIPNTDSERGRFYNAPITRVNAPVIYERIAFDAFTDTEELQIQFLSNIKHDRFLSIKNILGINNPKSKNYSNHILDAFNLWCAEHNKCDYFLTLDFKLIHKVMQSKDVIYTELITPSKLYGIITS